MAYEVTECYDYLKELFYPTPPKYTALTFTAEAWYKLMCFIHLVGDYEITGFGRVIDDKIVDVEILKQTVRSSTVDVDVDEMLRFIMKQPQDQRGQWVLDWHSHVNMGTFVSGTDSTNYSLQYKARLNSQYPYLIVNKHQSCLCECYVNPSKQTKIDLKIIKSTIFEERLKAIYEYCKKQVSELCSKVSYATTTHIQRSIYGIDYKDYDDWDNGATSNKIDLSNVKKNDFQNITNCSKEKERSAKDKNYCISCEAFLVEPSEYARGICDDCWEQMSFRERSNWCNEHKLSPQLVGLG